MVRPEAQAGCVGDHLDGLVAQRIGRPDARTPQQRRGPGRTRAQHDRPGADHARRAVGADDLHPDRSPALDHHPAGGRGRTQLEVGARPCRIQERHRGAHPAAPVHVARHESPPEGSPAVQVQLRGMAGRRGSGEEGLGHRMHRVGVAGHGHRAGSPVQRRIEDVPRVGIRLDPPHRRQHTLGTPQVVAERGPAVEVGRGRPHEVGTVHRSGPTDDTAPDQVRGRAARADRQRVADHQLVVRRRQPLGIEQPGRPPLRGTVRSGLDQEHPSGRALAQARGERGAAAAGAHHHHVDLVVRSAHRRPA